MAPDCRATASLAGETLRHQHADERERSTDAKKSPSAGGGGCAGARVYSCFRKHGMNAHAAGSFRPGPKNLTSAPGSLPYERHFMSRRRFLLLQRTMQKAPQTFAEKFNGFFTPRLLIMIIGALLGLITVRLLGF